MPIYEFRCLNCQKEFEELILGSSPSLKCPHCGSSQVEKLLSAFSFKSGGDSARSSPSSTSSCNTCSSSNCSTCR